MELLIAQIINLILIAIFIGTEFAIGFLIHPVLSKLPQSIHLSSVQVIGKIIGKIMPIWIPLIIVSALFELLFIRDTQTLSFWFIVAGVICMVVMLIISLAINVPINKQVIEWNPQAPPDKWLKLRRRWDKVHKIRILLDFGALVFFILAALC